VGIFADYIKSLKSVEVEEYFDLVVYRPLGFVFVKLVYHTPLTPNQITILSAIAGLAGGVCIGMGTPAMLVTAAILLIVYDVLDCADGQLARLKQTDSGRCCRLSRQHRSVSRYRHRLCEFERFSARHLGTHNSRRPE
jgi:hypothetical protein